MDGSLKSCCHSETFIKATFLRHYKEVFCRIFHCIKSIRIRSYSGPYFLAFGLNTERYKVFLRIYSECGKMRTRITPNTGTFYEVFTIMPGSCFGTKQNREEIKKWRTREVDLIYINRSYDVSCKFNSSCVSSGCYI